MKWKIPLFRIYADDKDVESVREVIEARREWATGPWMKKFEKRIASYMKVKYALSFSSGTTALHATMLACGIKEGDEVIVPSFTFIATANAPLFVGAKPVFAEIEEQTLGLDPEDVERKITPSTKAILPIHYAGIPCRIEKLKEIAKKYGIFLIEDAAESFGAIVKGRLTGTFGIAGVLSFCQNKIITTGEGGAVITDSEEIYRELKLVRSHGRAETEGYFTSSRSMDYVALGYNFRMSSITAALGISQIEKVELIIEMRRERAKFYNERLKEMDEVEVFEDLPGERNVYQLYTIKVKKKRDELREYLHARGIQTKVYFEPVHLTTFYRERFGYKEGDMPVTERISKEVLTLPFYPDLPFEDMEYIVNSIKEFYSHA